MGINPMFDFILEETTEMLVHLRCLVCVGVWKIGLDIYTWLANKNCDEELKRE
jgi:hypothetical protein